MRSPFDSPTEQFAAPAGAKTEKLTKDLPRTDEDLGLEPDVPLYSELKNSIPGASSPADTAPTYGFASIPPAPAAPGDAPSRPLRRDDRRGTLDLGLLVLRLVIGGTFIYHGLQKLTGWFHGPGLEGTKNMMENGGWDQPSVAASLLIVGELGGGILVVLGLWAWPRRWRRARCWPSFSTRGCGSRAWCPDSSTTRGPRPASNWSPFCSAPSRRSS
ncbi:DoxX family protein [Nocardia crassostreae]|uniref:DoxX family protein n=1 Tax=Nocardia crassostreae TaxID=53428 RepID=UPI00083359AD|nr:DoxX family protein [Nocardia crassostreae]